MFQFWLLLEPPRQQTSRVEISQVRPESKEDKWLSESQEKRRVSASELGIAEGWSPEAGSNCFGLEVTLLLTS